MTANSRKLLNPPVREAVIDIQFTPAVALGDLERYAETMVSEFDKSSPMWRTDFGLQVGSDGAEPAHASQVARYGLRLQSTHRPYVLQCRLNGFTLSRLPPYESWAVFTNTARLHWEKYVEVVASNERWQGHITQTAVRYINELHLPLPLRDFSDYLAAPPEVPPSLPQALQSFLQRVVIPLPETQSVAIVTQALDAPLAPADSASVILDIDIKRPFVVDVYNQERLWNGLEALRTEKNRIFFSYITEKLLEILK